MCRVEIGHSSGIWSHKPSFGRLKIRKVSILGLLEMTFWNLISDGAIDMWRGTYQHVHKLRIKGSNSTQGWHVYRQRIQLVASSQNGPHVLGGEKTV